MEDQIIPAGETLYNSLSLSLSLAVNDHWNPTISEISVVGFFYFPFRCIPSFFFFFFFVHKRVSTSFVVRLSLWRAGRHSPRISSLRFFFFTLLCREAPQTLFPFSFLFFFLLLYVTWWKPVSLDRPLNGGPTHTRHYHSAPPDGRGF